MKRRIQQAAARTGIRNRDVPLWTGNRIFPVERCKTIHGYRLEGFEIRDLGGVALECGWRSGSEEKACVIEKSGERS